MDSAIIEVGIGLVMVYFVLSIVVTQLNNLIVNSLNLRAETLHAWFRQNLQEGVREELLRNLGILRENDEQNRRWLRKALKRLGRKVVGVLVPGAGEQRYTTDVSNVAPTVFADTLLGMCKQQSQNDAADLQALRAFVRLALAECALEPILASVTSYEEARNKVAVWFDDAMTHLSSLFKRRVQFIAFIAGLFVCVTLNVDSLYLARTLWNDPTVRQTVATAALQTLQRGSDPNTQASVASVDDLTNKLQPLLDLRLPIGWEIEPVVRCSAEAAAAQTCMPTAQAVAEVAQASPRNLANFLPANDPIGGWLNFALYKLAGWILTTFAIMQGSEFWFNLLGRITAARTQMNKLAEAMSGGQPAAPGSVR